MDYEVIFTEEVRQDLIRVIEYLKSEWSEKTAGVFAIRFFNRIEILCRYIQSNKKIVNYFFNGMASR